MNTRALASAKDILTIVVALCWFSQPAPAHAAPVQTVSGAIRNAETGEALIGATIIVRELKNTGATSNAYGFYSLTIPEGRYTLSARYVGFHPGIDSIILLDRSRRVDFRLTPDIIPFDEVVASGVHSERNVSSTDMGVKELDVRTVRFVSVLLGERDILKTVQLLPGIKSEGEGRTGNHARGGATDQNLVLLDEAPIYNTSHLLGFLSVFNSDAIKDVKVITGGIPAEYGGRLSSILDIRTMEGNTKEFGASGGIGLLASHAKIDGPIGKEGGSFLVSARRTYADLFFGLAKNPTIRATSIYFYDLNGKVNYRLGEDDRVYFSAYRGHDHFVYPDVLGFDWGNNLATLRWNHLFTDQLFLNASLIYSNYEYENSVGSGLSQFTVSSGIKDVNLKTDFQLFLSPENTVKFGLNAVHHTFTPGIAVPGPLADAGFVTSIPPRIGLEGAAYLSQETDIAEGLKVNYGVRLSFFDLVAPEGDLRKTYASLEPRLAVNVRLDETSALKASFTRMAQYLHLVSNSSPTNPIELWLPSSSKVSPQYAEQVSLGYFKNLAGDEFETSLEIYYKDMRNLLEPRSGAELMLNPAIESDLYVGRGWSYGTELLLKKSAGRLTGWIAYTLSRTREQFPQIDGGRAFPARQDRTHDLALVAVYDCSSRWRLSATWVFHTGDAATFPASYYMIDGRVIPFYAGHNTYRMPAYHRLDLSATLCFSERSSLNLSVYNAYNRANAFAIIFRASRTDPSKTEAVQLTLFPITPSLTYNFSL